MLDTSSHMLCTTSSSNTELKTEFKSSFSMYNQAFPASQHLFTCYCPWSTMIGTKAVAPVLLAQEPEELTLFRNYSRTPYFPLLHCPCSGPHNATGVKEAKLPPLIKGHLWVTNQDHLDLKHLKLKQDSGLNERKIALLRDLEDIVILSKGQALYLDQQISKFLHFRRFTLWLLAPIIINFVDLG